MRTKAERRLLHVTEKPASNNTISRRQNGSYYSKVKGKNFKVTRVKGQDYYNELKTKKQIEEG
jgi:predicted RNA-binding protein|tara:strand:- start:425 stop:613 length:189 start_codon:yes stop_codon:yes gene_type:complete